MAAISVVTRGSSDWDDRGSEMRGRFKKKRQRDREKESGGEGFNSIHSFRGPFGFSCKISRLHENVRVVCPITGKEV